MSNGRIRVLIIDESVLCRDAVASALAEAKDIEVLGAAPNASTGLARSRQLQPDLLLVGAPVGGIAPEQFVQQAVAECPGLGVLLLASPTADAEQVDLVVRTLGAGAFDCLLKPERPLDSEAGAALLGRRLLPKIRAFSAARYSRVARGIAKAATPQADLDELSERLQKQAVPGRFELLAVAISTGGPEALRELLPALPASFPLPVVVVIHLPSPFTASLARTLDRYSAVQVSEARDGAALRPGTVQLAAGGLHMTVDRAPQGHLLVRTSDAPPVNGCRPSADLLFRSAAACCQRGVIGLIMTGMGSDGVRGLAELRAAGSAYVIAQDEASSVVWGMPGAAVRAGVTDEVLPLSAISARLARLVAR